MTPTDIVVVDYAPRFGRELVKMWRGSFERAVGVTDPHTLDEQLQYLEQHLVPENRVSVVLEESTSKVIGFMASTPDTISQLYLHIDHQNRGIGSMLLDMAKRQSSGRLRLFTFKVNTKAQRFYERHGFRKLRFGVEKEWGLADVEYEWLGSDLETKAC